MKNFVPSTSLLVFLVFEMLTIYITAFLQERFRTFEQYDSRHRYVGVCVYKCDISELFKLF